MPLLVSTTLLCLVALLGSCGDPPREGPRPPNIILISIDALRRDHLGLYGYERNTSPNLDRFAQECVVYDQSYAVAPWTLISHMTMLTGLFPSQHGVVTEDTRLSPEVPLLAERLEALGYHSLGLYYEGWIHERYGFDRGFDEFVSYDRMRDMLPKYQDAMDDRPSEAPLFLFLHVWDVHCQDIREPGSTIYDPPPPYDRLFMEDAKERLAGIAAEDMFLARVDSTPEQRAALVALYDGGIRYVDDVLGRWIEEWREAGILDDALVIITSDHGESLLERPGVGGHGAMYQEALRTPLLVRYPGGSDAGRRRTEIVSQVDFLPTVLDCLELPQEGRLPGTSLRGELPGARTVFAAKPPLMALIEWPWKLIWREGQGPSKGKLFQLEDDPGEQDPLTRKQGDRHREVLEQVQSAARARMRTWRTHPGAVGSSEPATDEEREALRAVGYLGDK